MSSDGDSVAVKTYVPRDQREIWREEADDLDMSQAEYVRSMVQAGRRTFDLGTDGGSPGTGSSNPVEAGSADATPGGEALKDRILEVLRAEEVAGWDELVAGVTDDIEDRLDEALEELQSEDRIRHSGRYGGYTVIEDGR